MVGEAQSSLIGSSSQRLFLVESGYFLPKAVEDLFFRRLRRFDLRATVRR